VVTNLDTGIFSGNTQIDAQFMHDTTTVTSNGSLRGLNIFNLQNFISTVNIQQSDAPGGIFLGLRMIDGTIGGTQTINLDHAGSTNGVFLADETTSDNDIVTEFDINSIGKNKLTIDGTSVAQTFKVTDTGSSDVTTITALDETEALTLIDTTGVKGTVNMTSGFEAEGGLTLQVKEGNGTNNLGIVVEDNAKLIVNGGSGTDSLDAHFELSDAASPNGGFIQIIEGNGKDTLDVDNDSNGNFQTVLAAYGNGNDNLDVQSGTNANVQLFAGNGNDTVGVHVLEKGFVKVALGDGANNVTVDNGEQSTVSVTGGNGGNTVTINTNDADSATISPINEVDGHQTYTVKLGTGTDHVNIGITGGSDPTFVGPLPPFFIFGDDGTSDSFFFPGSPGSENPNGEPDSVVASNQTITVALGDGGTALAPQTANIETGVNSSVTLTSGNGVDVINITANNDLWSMDNSDNATFVGEGGSQIKVNTLNGNKTINVNVDNTGFDFVSNKWLDAGSNVQITTGNGNNNVIVTLGTATQGNTANVQTGSGNDRVQFDVADINAGIVANGGGGTNTIALVSASAGASAANLAGISNFKILEVTNVLAHNVNLDNYEPANTINHVVLDQGFGHSGFDTISGIEQNGQIDVLADSFGSTLHLVVDNAAINTNDAIGIKLSADHNGTDSFGTITAFNVESITLDSTASAPLAAENDLALVDVGLKSLTIQHDAAGDVTLNLDGSIITGLTTVNAAGFTGGIIENDGALLSVTSFSASSSGNDNLVFGNGNDIVTLGGGNNTVVFGTGSDQYHVNTGSGTNNVTFNTSAGKTDIVDFNGASGAETVTFTGTGGSGSTITFSAHGGNTDTVAFNNVAESAFTLPDTITGFQAGTDILHFASAMITGAPTFDFFTVTSDFAASTIIAGDSAGNATFVYNSTTGHLFVDVNHNAVADMEITLVGTPAIHASNIAIS
jgi:hypothetical protein